MTDGRTDAGEGAAAIDFGDGLLPAVAQDAGTGEVLMLAYVSPEALDRTRETGYAHYYSRSRDELWKKGETSGHVQRVRDVRIDCDGDALLYRVDQEGGARHTGQRSCFYRRIDPDAEAASDDPARVPVETVGERTFEPDAVYE